MTRVLIIEDNPDNMLLICDILEAQGYDLLQAETGLQGVEMAEKYLPDFIILDIQLPDILGDEVLRRIRAKPSTQSIPIVAMTSYAMVGDREQLLADGCDGCVEKPIDPDVVLDEIMQAIASKL